MDHLQHTVSDICDLSEAQYRKDWLRSVVLHILLVSSVGLLDSSIVSNVLPLRVDTIEVQSLPINQDTVVAVLVYDALSLLQIFLLRLWLPPVYIVTILVLGARSRKKNVEKLKNWGVTKWKIFSLHFWMFQTIWKLK